MKRKYLPIVLCICFAITGCGQTASEISTGAQEQDGAAQEISAEVGDKEVETAETASADEQGLLSIDEWEKKWFAENDTEELPSTEKFDADQYDEKVVESKVDEAIKNSKSIAEELKSVDAIAYYYTNYQSADLGQQEMNGVSVAESHTWDYEIQSLYKRILEEADDSKKDSIKAEQDAWKADFDRCYEATRYDEGSWAFMQNSGLDARFMKSRSYMLAKELADIRGENFELPKRFFRENSYVSEDAILDITAGMEGGSILITYAPKGKEPVNLLCYDPMINENTISFKTTCKYDDGEEVNTNEGDTPIVGTVTYGWDGATLIITESGDKNLPAGTEVKFPTAM